MKSKGFTLTELIMVIVLLGLLSITAVPKFLSFSTDARSEVINQVQASVEQANDFAYYKSLMKSYSKKAVPGRPDLFDVDLDGNGSFETRLKWGYLDNTDIEKRIVMSEQLAIQYQGISYTFIGWDFDQDGQVNDDNCYFLYTQAASDTTPPVYSQEHSNC